MAHREHLSLKVYDMLGKEVAEVVNEEQTAGLHELSFNGADLACGVYYYRLISGSFVDTKKFLLVK
ncbi:MAG: T9SS type A sorting domain-containing protein [Ignavibacteriae bacterium]|nr:T9SS type A sorting domain-containing protein [Ignavibacteriota bacterium]